MKILTVALVGFSLSVFAVSEVSQNQNFDGTYHYLETKGLARPLLVIKAPKGFIACGYIDVEACNKTKEACAIVSGVSNQDEMKKAKILKVSVAAAELGVKVGMEGVEALKKLK